MRNSDGFLKKNSLFSPASFPALIVIILTCFGSLLASAQNLRCETLFNPSYETQQEIAMKLARLRVEIYTLEGDEKRVSLNEFNQLLPEFEKAIANKEVARQLLEESIQKLQKEQSHSKKIEKQIARDRELEQQFIKSQVIDGTQGIMHPIEPGSFGRGSRSINVTYVTLTKPFEMMATATTQLIWNQVAQLITQKLPGRNLIIADPSLFKGDTRPVESVSYNQVQAWIDGLNELSQMDEPHLAEIFPGHQKGDKYRLPTEAEWEFVVTGRGQLKDDYHFGNNSAELGDYAWYSKNSGGETHPVAQRKPLEIDGMKFYDMHGNVWEWMLDGFQTRLPGGQDPLVPAMSGIHSVRGGSYGNGDVKLQYRERFNWETANSHSMIGFRLVRTKDAPL